MRKTFFINFSFSTLYGSKWVATTVARSQTQPGRCFSTLYGSKWVATRRTIVQRVNFQQFQYPLRVEVGCNCAERMRWQSVPRVSVPSTGRSGLQPRRGRALKRVAPVSVPSTGRSGLQRNWQRSLRVC